MEAALASVVLKIAGNKLAQLLTGEFDSIKGVTKDLSELQGLFAEITAWFSPVWDRAIENDPWIRWVKKLKDIAYDIDDLLYDAHLEAEKHNAGIHGDNHVTASCFYAKPKSVMFRCKMAHKIKTIKERFAAIVKQRSDFNAIVNNLTVDRPGRRNNNTIGEMSILGNVGESTIRVRDEEKQRIISKLVETNEREKILTVSIVGLGGSGKTTLAKHICDDKEIKEHFQAAIYWVHVSQEFDVLKLIGKLFETIAKKKSDLEAQPHMVQEISDKLSSKKFLLVLDDAWHEDRQDWEQFMGFLKSGAPGSRILLTTRNKRVSEAVKSTDPFELELLQPDDSWKFFQQCSGWAEEAMDSEFIEVGKDIVSKCGGMPLAIKILAGVLFDKREINAWQDIRDNNLLSELDIQKKVMGSLKLSYFHLRDDLKQCFVLCSIFPKGYLIDKEQLIDQWIAHDMITPTDGVGYLEYIKCFNSLVQTSFLQDVQEADDGRVTCRMHDLVHDLSRFILGDEISPSVRDKTTKSTKSYRYFSLIEWQANVPSKHFFEKGRAMHVVDGDFIFGKALKKAKHLRSITVENVHTEPVLTSMLPIKNLRYLAVSGLICETLPEAISDIWSLQALHVPNSPSLCELPKSFGKLQKLRTLNLSGCRKLKSLPDSIGNCHMISSLDLYECRELTTLPNSISGNKNLRVLRLGRTRIERLPSSVTTLGNLEILDLENCFRLVELPEGMTDLKKLKALNLEGCEKLCGIPVGIEQLSRLEKLGLFVVGEGENFAKILELGNAGGIGGCLTISNIAFVKDPDDAQKACLKHKANLQGLILEWCSEISYLAVENRSNHVIKAEKELAVLDALEPPSGIQFIQVNGYPGGQCARWMLKQVGVGEDHPCFPCLTRVMLVNFPNLKHLEFPCLPSLREVEFWRMPALENISGGPFPSLVNLDMYAMPSLEEVWMVALADEEEAARSGRHEMRIGSHLSCLTIRECPKLKVKPYLPVSLKYLQLEGSNEQLLVSPFRLGPSSDAKGLPPSYSHLKRLGLSGMTELSLGSGSAGCGWQLLQHLTVHGCNDLMELPDSMWSLTSLRSLNIEWCSALRVLPEWLGELRSLQQMTIWGCRSLSSLLPPTMQAQHLSGLSSLQDLMIRLCGGLSSLPESLGHLTSLQRLQIVECCALVQLPECLGELRSVRDLKIRLCSALSSLPDSLGHLTSLQRLQIVECCALVQLPGCLGKLCSLRDLKIRLCGGLSSLPESLGHLTSLQRLQIHGCDALDQLPESVGDLSSLRILQIRDSPCLPQSLQHLASLEILDIGGGCDALQQLPEFFGELRSLRTFLVGDLPGLTRLPQSMRRLTSLEELRIKSCPRLTSLPEGIQNLTNLKELAISGCPHLERRCKRVKGRDWHLISHIPRVRIN